MWCRTVERIITLALSLLIVPLTALAQLPTDVPRIGLLRPGVSPAGPDHNLMAFQKALHALGWVDGQNIGIEVRWPEAQEERLLALAADLVRLPVQVLVTVGAPATRAAQQATTTIPIVMVILTDPLVAGFVGSLARPGSNLTGVSGLGPEIMGKQLELLTEALPGIKRVAALTHPAHPLVSALVQELERAARALGVQLHLLEVPNADALDHALAALPNEAAEALIVLPFPLLFGQRQRILAFAAQRRLPVIATDLREWAEKGALLFYGVSLTDNYRRAAVYVDKLLKGVKPEDLPVERPKQIELVLNLKAAQALGLTISPTVLFQADEVIR
jgi:putative ABC transport system substrate-binding protein